MVICLERGADCLHMVQLMLLASKKNPIISWFYLSDLSYRLIQVVLEKRPLNVCSSSNYHNVITT